MFYLKAKLGDDVEIKVPFHGDNVFTPCTECGIEIEVDEELLGDLIQDGGLAGVSMKCGSCSK